MGAASAAKVSPRLIQGRCVRRSVKRRNPVLWRARRSVIGGPPGNNCDRFCFSLPQRLESPRHAAGRVAERAVAIGLEMHEELRLARRPPARQLGLEFVETDAPEADRSPERAAGVETPGDLVDAILSLARVTSRG